MATKVVEVGAGTMSRKKLVRIGNGLRKTRDVLRYGTIAEIKLYLEKEESQDLRTLLTELGAAVGGTHSATSRACQHKLLLEHSI